DIGGYFAGRRIGGPRLAPGISPNKTWAGLLGGMLLSVIAALGLGILFTFSVPAWWLVAAGAGLAIWAQAGDLAESAMKRHFGVKDSGTIIPGHGGVMDRLDGLVVVAPAVALGVWCLMLRGLM
ncbi:MAG: phosphatidate cytidylyltransferase, partial [Sphingomonadales bacterium]